MFAWVDVLQFDWCDSARLTVNQMWKSLGCHAWSVTVWLIVLLLVTATLCSLWLFWKYSRG